MTRQAVGRHVAHGHLGDAVAALKLDEVAMSHGALSAAVMRLHGRTLALLTAAETERDGKVAASMLREARAQLETMGKLAATAPEAETQSAAPAIDAAITAVLEARHDGVSAAASSGFERCPHCGWHARPGDPQPPAQRALMAGERVFDPAHDGGVSSGDETGG